jgi:hypothetical protein
MPTKLIFLVSFIFLLGVVSPGMGDDDPSLMGWWTFDDNALDTSGNGRHGKINDPNLFGWWKLDEGLGSVAVVDSSGHGHHGNIVGDSHWTAGYDGDALEFVGVDHVQTKNYKVFSAHTLLT